MTRIARALRLYIASENIEQIELSHAWGCSQSTVTRFLRGEAIPEVQTMLRIIQWCISQEPKQ